MRTPDRTAARAAGMSILAAALLSLAGCDGILGGIYDEEEDAASSGEAAEYGFTAVDAATHTGTIYIASNNYYLWTLINFHSLTIDSLAIDSTLADPFDESVTDWDIAVHRYDARTNGGAALETDCEDIGDLDGVPEGTYVEDEWTDSTVYVDMSRMLEEIIGYSRCYVNVELSKWMDEDISGMPPSYTLSNKVYVVRLADGTHAAVKLTNYMKNGGTAKGFLTIDYAYPLDE